jgi:hypothetical protein
MAAAAPWIPAAIGAIGAIGGSLLSDNDSTVNTEPWHTQADYLENMFGYGQGLYDQGPLQYYPGQTWVDPNQLELLGRSNALGYSTGPQLNSLIGNAQGSLNQALQGGMNPYLQDYLRMGSQAIGQNFREQLLPGIQQDAIAQGALGGSRQGIAEGLAADRASQSMEDFTTRLLSDAYGQGLRQQSAAWQVSPQLARLGLLPSTQQQALGALYAGDTQQMLQDAMSRWTYEQQAPWDLLSRYQGVVGGQGYGAQQTSNSNNLGNTLGLAGLTAYGLGDYFDLWGGGSGGDSVAGEVPYEEPNYYGGYGGDYWGGY